MARPQKELAGAILEVGGRHRGPLRGHLGCGQPSTGTVEAVEGLGVPRASGGHRICWGSGMPAAREAYAKCRASRRSQDHASVHFGATFFSDVPVLPGQESVCKRGGPAWIWPAGTRSLTRLSFLPVSHN